VPLADPETLDPDTPAAPDTLVSELVDELAEADPTGTGW